MQNFNSLKTRIEAKRPMQLSSADASFLLLDQINNRLEEIHKTMLLSNSQPTIKQAHVPIIEVPKAKRKWWQRK